VTEDTYRGDLPAAYLRGSGPGITVLRLLGDNRRRRLADLDKIDTGFDACYVVALPHERKFYRDNDGTQ